MGTPCPPSLMEVDMASSPWMPQLLCQSLCKKGGRQVPGSFFHRTPELHDLTDRLVLRRWRVTHVSTSTIAKYAQPLTLPQFPCV